MSLRRLAPQMFQHSTSYIHITNHNEVYRYSSVTLARETLQVKSIQIVNSRDVHKIVTMTMHRQFICTYMYMLVKQQLQYIYEYHIRAGYNMVNSMTCMELYYTLLHCRKSNKNI